MGRFLRLSGILATWLFSLTSWGQGAYNEMYDESGQLRPAYRQFEQTLAEPLFPIPPERVQAFLKHPMEDKIRILPTPLILSSTDYSLLQKGAVQRGRALHAFFVDLVFHEGRKMIEAGLIGPDFADYLSFAAHGISFKTIRQTWKGRSPEDLRFFYGADVVRLENGEFRVIEDNVNLIGGLADVTSIREVFESSYRLRTGRSNYLKNQILDFLKQTKLPHQASRVVALVGSDSRPTSSVPEDDEEYRRLQTLTELGIPVITWSKMKEQWGKIENATHIINFEDPRSRDLADRTSRLALLKRFTEGKLKLMMAPDIEILGNKSILALMDRMIEIYLDEEPILKTQPTEWITAPVVNPNDQGWVYKVSNSNQGAGVILMDALPKANAEVAAQEMNDWQFGDRTKNTWPLVVRQRYAEVSYIPAAPRDSWVRFNVDLRPLVYMTPEIKLNEVEIWGRANMAYPGSKNNVSIDAMEMVILTPQDCERWLSNE